MIEEEARSQIGNTNKIGEIYRYIAEMPKSKTSGEINGRNEVRTEWNRNRGKKLFGDYDMGDNHGLGEEYT